MTIFNTYISELNRLYSTGMAREHSYRPALKDLLASILPGMTIINEPARIDCGAPDYIICKSGNNIPIAFLEAKDIDDPDLTGRRQHREQFDRYKSSLAQIIFTDYLDFHFYKDGCFVKKIRIGETRGNEIKGIDEHYAEFSSMIITFAQALPQKITSASKLAKLMASKAKLLAKTIKSVLDLEESSYSSEQLRGQYEAVKNVLLHDITHEGFADIYAQTIAYGMFAARMHDNTPEDFSRQEAATLIPKSNPFLRKIFQSMAGYDLDDRVAWIVDDLAHTFSRTDMPRILGTYGANSRHTDPMIHLYEDFLSAYDPKLRKSKGVWYTPSPIVGFIVRSADEILQKDFNLTKGLADDSIIDHKVNNEDYDPRIRGRRKFLTKKFHRVQILDPAVGTGTFLAETVNRIHEKFSGMQGMWQSYVETNLLPRLNGFELLMAPYAIAHLKLDWLLSTTEYTHNSDKRFKIYLTNSLEEHHIDTDTIFSQLLSREANEASRIKRDSPVMVLLGNPPYNGSSSNNGSWITKLMESYKKEPGGQSKLKERNPKWLNDDYVKFIRMAQFYIERNGEGILAFINPHGFLDNPTFRGMRWELLQAFDSIYVIDLHGNAKKKETAPDGSKDENVFDIMQGVSINFFIKTSRNPRLANVYHYDLFGRRADKYQFLNDNSFSTVSFTKLEPHAPMYFFVPKDMSLEQEYNRGFFVNELFTVKSAGMVTTKDAFLICDSKDEVKKRINDLITLSAPELKEKYGLKDTRDWTIANAKSDVGPTLDESKIIQIDYRWGNRKFLYYTGLTNGIVAWPRFRSLGQLQARRNFALLTVRQIAGKEWHHVSVASRIAESCVISNKTKELCHVFPLYSVPGEAGSIFGEIDPSRHNLNAEILSRIERNIRESVEPLEIFDYVLGILSSKTYAKRYQVFLKGDFPKIPYPANKEEFQRISNIGNRLRKYHTFENSSEWMTTTGYPVSGNNRVSSIKYVDGKVFINETQYFSNVPMSAWEYWIGGYQPALKWLKDRKGNVLHYSELRHYMELIHALSKISTITVEIDSDPLWLRFKNC